MHTHKINLALQGGGSHGAFTWGVLDRLLEEESLEIAGVSGTSAGAMNAVALADGLSRGGPKAARDALSKLWEAVGRMPGLATLCNPFGLGQRFNLDSSPVYLFLICCPVCGRRISSTRSTTIRSVPCSRNRSILNGSGTVTPFASFCAPRRSGPEAGRSSAMPSCPWTQYWPPHACRSRSRRVKSTENLTGTAAIPGTRRSPRFSGRHPLMTSSSSASTL